MKPKILSTAQFIEQLKRKVKRKRISALCANDPKDSTQYEREASAMQTEVDRMQKAYGDTICTADRKF